MFFRKSDNQSWLDFAAKKVTSIPSNTYYNFGRLATVVYGSSKILSANAEHCFNKNNTNYGLIASSDKDEADLYQVIVNKWQVNGMVCDVVLPYISTLGEGMIGG